MRSIRSESQLDVKIKERPISNRRKTHHHHRRNSSCDQSKLSEETTTKNRYVQMDDKSAVPPRQ